MNLVFIGKGKLAQATMEIAGDRGHHLLAVHDSHNTIGNSWNHRGADLVFEMSRPDLVMSHARMAMEAGLPVVIGTTGWYSRMEELKGLCEQMNGSVLWASNFAPGVQIFRRLSRTLAGILDVLPEFRLELHETHHPQKLDRPSGTAIHTAQDMLSASSCLTRWEPEAQQSDPHVLPIHSHRIDGEVGTHTLIAQSPWETLTLDHKALHRRAFGLGAVMAAEWLHHRHGFHSIDDYYDSLWGGSAK